MSTEDTTQPKIQLRKLVLSRESMTTLTEKEAESVKGGAMLYSGTTTTATRSTVMCASTKNCCITIWE
jgi:hypothetical protein